MHYELAVPSPHFPTSSLTPSVSSATRNTHSKLLQHIETLLRHAKIQLRTPRRLLSGLGRDLCLADTDERVVEDL